MDRRWNWPFPIPKLGETPVIPELTPYLFCYTLRAHLIADRPDEDIVNSRYRKFTCCLRDVSGNCVGVLLPQDQEDMSHLSESNRKPQKIEVVEISRIICTQLGRGYDGEITYGILPMHTPYEYYNVLWINWDMGVVYRRGLGRILRDKWEQIRETQVIELMLR
jgi:hypothetical protein